MKLWAVLLPAKKRKRKFLENKQSACKGRTRTEVCVKREVMFDAYLLFMDFSLLHPLEFFAGRTMKMGEAINHPLCGCATDVIQKNYLSVYNRVVQAIL